MKQKVVKQSLRSLIFTSIVNKILVGVILFCMLINGFVSRSLESKFAVRRSRSRGGK